jgi:L-iditol 2-dehydrogenase
LELSELPEPAVGENEVLIRVVGVNVCPTDVKKWAEPEFIRALNGNPLVLGHEVAGEVVEVGPGVDELRDGDRVAVDPIVRRGLHPALPSDAAEEILGIGAAAGSVEKNASLLRDFGIGGGFSELLKIPAGCAIPLPDDVSFAAGSLVEPLADVVHSIEAAGPLKGRLCAVFGLGPMGIMHAWVLLSEGAEVVGFDPREDRRRAAAGLGLRVMTAPNPADQFDAAFVTAGRKGFLPATQAALSVLAPSGTVVLFASGPRGARLDLDVNRVHYNRQRLVGVVGFERPHALRAIQLLHSGVIDVEAIRQPHFPLRRVQQAFEHFGDPGTLKIAIDMPGGP